MANIAFSKLASTEKQKHETEIIINGTKIKVKTYLPVAEKLDFIASVIEKAGDGESGFFNITKLRTFWTIELIKRYTNIIFSAKQEENETKLYDIIVVNHIDEKIKEVIDEKELSQLWDDTCALAREVTNFNHSALGILRAVTREYNNASLDLTQVANTLKDPESLKLLKEIAPLLGVNE